MAEPAKKEEKVEEPKKKGAAVIKPAAMTKEQKEALKRQFELHKAAKGLLPLAKVRKCLERAQIDIREKELGRMIKLADIVCDDEDLLTCGQLINLARNQVDVNMLHKLFNYANTNVKDERVEFFLDGDEIYDLFVKLGLDRSKEEIFKAIDELDDTGDRDGRIDWEEFLGICSILLGASIAVDKNDPDGTDFNQLRDSTNRMKENLVNTHTVVKELNGLIQEKKKEIEKRIKDTTLEDIRKILKKEWDQKDVLEIAILDNKKANFEELSKLLNENDKEKADLKVRFTQSCAERDQTRGAIDQKREEFRTRFKTHFSSFKMIMDLLDEISDGAKVVTDGLAAVDADEEEMQNTYETMSEFETAPQVSNSEEAKDFVKNQSMVINEIKTKMQMMQRERDKYEDMIEAEMVKNQVKRVECVKLNMRITNLESRQLAVEQRFQEQSILSQTLAKELQEKTEDTDSKKVKGLRNTVFQFNEEKMVVVGQVEDTKSKLRMCKMRYSQMNNKVSQLNIELGELKILLEICANVQTKSMLD